MQAASLATLLAHHQQTSDDLYSACAIALWCSKYFLHKAGKGLQNSAHNSMHAWAAGPSCPAGLLGYPPQSGNNLTAPIAASSCPTAPKPAASLLTQSQHKANVKIEEALQASTNAAKLKGVRLSLKAAFLHIQQAASKTVAADTNCDR